MNNEVNDMLKKMFDQVKDKLLSDSEIKRIERERFEAERDQRATERLAASGIPKRFREHGKTLEIENPWGSKAAEIGQRVGSGMLLLLFGPPGTGKTQLAAELVKKGIISHGLSGCFCTGSWLKLAVKDSWATNSEKQLIDRLRNTGILVIDEIDWLFGAKETATEDYWTSSFYHIINCRYNDLQDTVLTSNRTLPELKRILPAPVWGRINETGGVISTDGWTNWRAR